MVQLNKAEFVYRPGMILKELVDEYNTDHEKQLAFDGFVVLVNGIAHIDPQVREKILRDNDKIVFLPLLDGG